MREWGPVSARACAAGDGAVVTRAAHAGMVVSMDDIMSGRVGTPRGCMGLVGLCGERAAAQATTAAVAVATKRVVARRVGAAALIAAARWEWRRAAVTGRVMAVEREAVAAE